MVEDVTIIGIVMAVAEIIKYRLKRALSPETVTRLLPLLVLGLAGGLQVANAAVFTPGANLVEALGQGLTLGAMAGGVYSLGKAALGKS